MNVKEKIKLLPINIEELRRKYDELCDNYASIKNRVMTFLAGSLALLAFLYGSGDLFIPKETYGQIFYWIGFFVYVFAIILLVWAIQPVTWHSPVDAEKLDKLKLNSEEEYLEYIENDYVKCLNINRAHCETKHSLMGASLKLLIIGGIVLVILKNFNTQSNLYVPYERYHYNQGILNKSR